MIVLHAAWLPSAGELALWSEDGDRPRTLPPRRGRPPRKPRPEPHPFASDASGIRLAATELGGFPAEELLVGAREIELSLRLPSTNGRPVSSPGLEDDAEIPPQSVSGSSWPIWTAPAIALKTSVAAQAVIALAGSGSATASDASGIVAATDLRFAARSAELVLELTTRGRMLPALVHTENGWHARWRPLVGQHRSRPDRGPVMGSPAFVPGGRGQRGD